MKISKDLEKAIKSAAIRKKCFFCPREISRANYNKHLHSCLFNPIKKYVICNCVFCSKECKNSNSRINHERFCKKNPNAEISPFVLYHKNTNIKKPKARNFEKGNIPWNKGKSGKKGFRHSKEFKEKISQRLRRQYENGWSPKAGRCKKYRYFSRIAGEVTLDGTWELVVAKWLDKLNYNWRRNTKRFPYIKPNGTCSYYTPDFWVEQLGGYLEIKGYETELDRCKWKQFPEKLTIWKKQEIENLHGE